MLNVVCLGNIEAGIVVSVDSLPYENDIANADKININSGGGAVNAAVNISKIGAKTAICGKIGADILGSFLLSSLHDANVNTEGLIISDSLLTTSSILFKTSEGSSYEARHKGANNDFSLSDINWTIIEKSGVVFISGLMGLTRFNSTACEMFLKKCKLMGKKTVLDIKSDSGDLRGKSFEGLPDILKYIDFFLPSYEYAAALSGCKLLESASLYFTAKGAGTCIIKHGAKGAYVKESNANVGYLLPAYKNITEVDKTGAGDAFCSGFVYGVTKSMSIRQSALIGNAAAAMCIMQLGATANIKPYPEIKKFMERAAK